MKRRDFIKTLAAAGLMAGHPWLTQQAKGATLTPYRGNFFVSISADGGWDVTSLCDPKANTSINHWANSQSIQTIPNSPIQYAPFAHNSNFFQTHHQNMLVINGIDCQTNAHEAGVRHTWSGRLAHGYPSFSAIAAATLGPNLPLAYISNGGYKETAGITQYTLMQDPTSLKKLVFPNQFLDYDTEGSWDPAKQYHRTAAINLIQQAKLERLTRLRSQSQLTPKQAIKVAEKKYTDAIQAELDIYAPLHLNQAQESLTQAQESLLNTPKDTQGAALMAAIAAQIFIDDGYTNKKTVLANLTDVLKHNTELLRLEAPTRLPADYDTIKIQLLDLM